MNLEDIQQDFNSENIVNDQTDGIHHTRLEEYWLKTLAKHQVIAKGRARLHISDTSNFDGEIVSGSLCSLSYTRIRMGSCQISFPYERDHATEAQLVMLQASGQTKYTTDKHTFIVSAGDVLLINQSGIKQVEHIGRTDVIVFHNPFDAITARMLQCLYLPVRHSSTLPVRILANLCKELLPCQSLTQAKLVEDLGSSIASLLRHMFLERPSRPQASSSNRLKSEDIEKHIQNHLEDPSLSLPSIAQAFQCSLRTLHRCFKEKADLSLEVYIWKQRVVACADVLRDPHSSSMSLTEVAMRFGFSNPSQFSSMFRRFIGISPSQYRSKQLDIEMPLEAQ